VGLNMSWLWIRPNRTADAATALGVYWSKLIESDSEHPQRQLMILSAPGDRTLVMDSTSEVDLELATWVCGELGTEGLWVQLSEVSLSWRVCRLGGSLIVEDIDRPEKRDDGGIRDYGDPAQDLWNWLEAERIPPPLRIPRIRDFEGVDGEEWNAVTWTRASAGAEVTGQKIRLGLRDEKDPSGPPIEFSVGDIKTKRAFEIIVFNGTPDPAGLRRLLKALDRVARRKAVGEWTWEPSVKWMSPDFGSDGHDAKSKEVLRLLREEYVRGGGAARYRFDLH
jgi:hypothetical protein